MNYFLKTFGVLFKYQKTAALMVWDGWEHNYNMNQEFVNYTTSSTIIHILTHQGFKTTGFCDQMSNTYFMLANFALQKLSSI